jgi:hypothetical protein
MTPLDYLVSVYRDETATRPERLEAAAKAAPYVHPRLSAIEYTARPSPRRIQTCRSWIRRSGTSCER